MCGSIPCCIQVCTAEFFGAFRIGEAASLDASDDADKREYRKQKTAELHQAKVREIRESAKDAALHDEALALEEEHLEAVIDTLREFAGLVDSPASSLLEQAREVGAIQGPDKSLLG